MKSEKYKHILNELLKSFLHEFDQQDDHQSFQIWIANGELPLRMCGPTTRVFTGSAQKIFKNACLTHWVKLISIKLH